MGIFAPTKQQDATVVNQVPIGGITDVTRSGDQYKAVGESASRTLYSALSSAFPRSGTLDTITSSASAIDIKGYSTGTVNGASVTVAVGSAASGAATTIALYSYDGREWFQSVMPSSEVWISVAFGAGLFCAISSTGKVATSPDGITWTARTALAAGSWYAIAFGSAKFVAIQGSGSSAAASSADGITFTARTLPTTSNWMDVIFAGGQFLAVAYGPNAAATSPDGITWTARTMPTTSSAIGRIAYGAGKYVVVGAGRIYSSADGATWTEVVSGISSFQGVIFGNGVFIAFSVASGGTVFTSYDGTTWKRRAVGGSATIAGSTAAGYVLGVFFILNTVGGLLLFAENLTDSDYLYLRGTAGKFVRVK